MGGPLAHTELCSSQFDLASLGMWRSTIPQCMLPSQRQEIFLQLAALCASPLHHVDEHHYSELEVEVDVGIEDPTDGIYDTFQVRRIGFFSRDGPGIEGEINTIECSSMHGLL